MAIAAPGLSLGAWILLADASQGIMTGALRGAADIWPCIGVQFVCVWLICAPLCYLLAHRFGLGVPGLLWGLFVGLVGAALLLAWRFRALTAREVRPF